MEGPLHWASQGCLHALLAGIAKQEKQRPSLVRAMAKSPRKGPYSLGSTAEPGYRLSLSRPETRSALQITL